MLRSLFHRTMKTPDPTCANATARLSQAEVPRCANRSRISRSRRSDLTELAHELLVVANPLDFGGQCVHDECVDADTSTSSDDLHRGGQILRHPDSGGLLRHAIVLSRNHYGRNRGPRKFTRLLLDLLLNSTMQEITEEYSTDGEPDRTGLQRFSGTPWTTLSSLSRWRHGFEPRWDCQDFWPLTRHDAIGVIFVRYRSTPFGTLSYRSPLCIDCATWV